MGIETISECTTDAASGVLWVLRPLANQMLIDTVGYQDGHPARKIPATVRSIFKDYFSKPAEEKS